MQCTALKLSTESAVTPASPTAEESTIRYRRPVTDVFESAEGWLLSVELPGVAKADVALRVEGDVLELKASRDEASGFSRRFRLPRGVDRAEISARHEHGILRVSVPREPDSAPVAITVA